MDAKVEARTTSHRPPATSASHAQAAPVPASESEEAREELRRILTSTPHVQPDAAVLQRKCATCQQAEAHAGEPRKCATCEQKKKLVGALQRKAEGGGLEVRPADDAYEREADRVASAVMAGGFARVQGRVGGGASAQRNAGGAEGGLAAAAIVRTVPRSEGTPLDASTRAFMEAGMGHGFGNVRIHTDAQADDSARAMNALAYTVGQDIVFRSGQYDPASENGRRLLAHELAHVCQQDGGSSNSEKLQRQQEPSGGPAPLTSRLAAFQRLVKEAGKLRLAQNERALKEWRQLLEQQLTPAQVRMQVHAEEVRALLAATNQEDPEKRFLLEQWLQTSGPNRRWVLEKQITEDRYVACTRCHVTVQAEAMDRWLVEQGRQFRTPLEQLPADTDTGPRPTFTPEEQVLPTGQPVLFPATAQAQERINTLRPYLRALGPDGYRVLPRETLGSSASPDQLVADIGRRITQRQADYLELSRRIDAADFDYIQLRPIVGDLLPLADADVRQAVLDAIATAQAWETFESIVIGAASIGLLLLAIFPPTSAIGIGGALALGTAVGAHQVYRGYQSFEQGRLYSLGRGANNVLDPAQQEAADALMAMGALNMVLGTVSVASGPLGAVRLIRSLPPPGGGLGALQAIEGRAGGNLYRVTGWGTREPRVVVTSANGRVIQEGPLSSFKPSAVRGAQAPTRGGSGGAFYPTDAGAARVAQPIPVVEPVPPTAVVPRSVPTLPIPSGAPTAPNVRAPLATMGGTAAVDSITASGGPSKEPVMPRGLSRAKKELWKACNQLHTRYKATQEEYAALKAQMTPLRAALLGNQASAQDRMVYCALLNKRMALAERLKTERKQYMDMDCDQFDWFGEGKTEAERRARHQDEWGNVKASLGNLYEDFRKFCS